MLEVLALRDCSTHIPLVMNTLLNGPETQPSVVVSCFVWKDVTEPCVNLSKLRVSKSIFMCNVQTILLTGIIHPSLLLLLNSVFLEYLYVYSR